ncbi:MAG: alkaline phosphatase [Anaerolineae bacterium]|nr:alkaline phosphatase [Gloeobacterales cyanobacterium ES-bin-313]
MKLKHATLVLAATLVITNLTAPAFAGPDDDARFRGNGTTRNNLDPIQNGGLFADLPTNAEPNSGLRIMPPTNTQLIQGQRFDLRVETQIPATATVVLKSLTVNGKDITTSFTTKITSQGLGLESGTPASALLYGASARNLTFSTPGIYVVVATVTIDGVDRTITNTYPVANYAFRGNVKHVVVFLGDAMGLPVRTAARIAGKGIFEGRLKGKLFMDSMDEYGLVATASYDSIITDSAPGMANYVTGLKQPNNGLNVSADNTPETNLDNPRIETLWEFMKRTQGWKTGVVTDAFVTDATPASEAGHTRSRGDRAIIAQQFLDYYADGTAQPATGFAGLKELTQPLDVIMGGGATDWTVSTNTTLQTFYQYASGGRTAAQQDLFVVAQDPTKVAATYCVANNLTSLNACPSNKPLLGIFTGEFRTISSGLGGDNIPGVLDRLVARDLAKIGGKDATNASLGLNVAPPRGTGCGATVKDCFAAVPSKPEMVSKAISVLNTLAGRQGGWMLMIEQSQTDKLAHPLEYERVIYEALELDKALGSVLTGTANDDRTLTLVTADHAQPETIIGVSLPGSIVAGGATPLGSCFTASTTYPITLGSADTSTATGTDGGTRPCPLQDIVGTFNDATFPTYVDANNDGFPDDPDATVKIVIDDGGRPTYSQDYLTNVVPLNPSGSNAAFPNPARDPNGILLTGNMPTRNTVPTQPATGAALSTSSANKTSGSVGVAPHSGEDVPLSASGPGADLFAGVYDNTDVHVRIANALSGKTSRRSLNQGSRYTGVPFTTPAGTSLTGF